MKKLIGFLTVLFLFTVTSFSQNEINETMFNLTVDGVPSTDFMVTYNPQDQFNTMGAGVLLVYFNNPMGSVDFQGNGAVGVNYMADVVYTEPELGIGIQMIKVDYNIMMGGEVNIVATSFDEDIYLITEFHALDTLNAFNTGMEIGIDWGLRNGAESVNTDSIFNAGVNSVTQEFTESDTLMSWGNGYMEGYNDGSEKYYNNGFDAGVNSVVCVWTEQDTVNSFWNGFNSVDTMYYINKGATSVIKTEMAKSTTSSQPEFVDIGLTVYPNPVNQGEFINVDCYDFSHVDIYNMNGQKLNTSIDTYISTSELKEGFYVFHVWDTNGNLNSTKVVVQ